MRCVCSISETLDSGEPIRHLVPTSARLVHLLQVVDSKPLKISTTFSIEPLVPCSTCCVPIGPACLLSPSAVANCMETFGEERTLRVYWNSAEASPGGDGHERK